MSDVIARNRRNRRAGAAWQSKLRDELRGAGMDVERLVLTGVRDEGDHVIRRPRLRLPEFLVLEAKAGAMHPAAFVAEAATEAAHFAAHRGLHPSRVAGIAVVKRRSAAWRDAYVLTTVGTFFDLEDQ
ncbi:hypothetical protein GCM10010124_02400 [Pilimelia terevasa]|uniref:Holliday junction resolvase n=1 Tax=Pilimelia terevasa TaxID=53372 RepID=A0A8J3BJH5_9ACTN|nr:hypothetical protein [Pilimelia terevasa]GGK13358.1 hypothetical protein GCM10010124_02400 [Pilimelia terevasa]